MGSAGSAESVSNKNKTKANQTLEIGKQTINEQSQYF